MLRPEGLAGLLHVLRAATPPRQPRQRRPPRRRPRDGSVRSPQHPQALRRARGAGEHLAVLRGGPGHGIMGPNGAGKSTCFNVLTGQHPPDRGAVLFDGQRHHRPAAAAASRGWASSRSFQIMNLFDDYRRSKTCCSRCPTSEPPSARDGRRVFCGQRPDRRRRSPCSTRSVLPAAPGTRPTALSLWRAPRAGDRRGARRRARASCSSTSRRRGSASEATRSLARAHRSGCAIATRS